jgi:hypothetical protein
VDQPVPDLIDLFLYSYGLASIGSGYRVPVTQSDDKELTGAISTGLADYFAAISRNLGREIFRNRGKNADVKEKLRAERDQESFER